MIRIRFLALGLLLPAALALLVATTGAGGTDAESRQERRARILAPTTDFSRAEPHETMQGGSGTNRTRLDRNAFSLPSAALTFEERADFFVGNGVFDRPWVAAPASTIASDGLGPHFNARSCQGCHIKDGRGHPPEPGEASMVSMVFALSGPDGAPDPVLGRQLQDQAIPGRAAEGRVRVTYADVPFRYADGTVTMLRRPTYVTDASLAPGTALAPRIAPPMIGLGLVEAIAETDILAHADPDGPRRRRHLGPPRDHAGRGDRPVRLEGVLAEHRAPIGDRLLARHGPVDAAVPRALGRLHARASRLPERAARRREQRGPPARPRSRTTCSTCSCSILRTSPCPPGGTWTIRPR